MTQQSQQQQLKNGDTLPRPSDYFQVEGFVNGFNWDRNQKSGRVYIGITRTFGQGSNERKTFHKACIRVYGREAYYLSGMNDWLISERKENRKTTAFIDVSVRWASYERDTGRKWTDNNQQEQVEMEDLMFFEGNSVIQVDPSTRVVLGQGKFHPMPEDEQQQVPA